ncbi:hypothetical protein ERO13_A05G206700v2 [Gossypium hirsutum]|uniref:Uncharacterized protein n=4 Tax=Gossypium TaxID=3633 RepID=A0A5J5VSA6_GOSBA|nr:hypothetical protein ES319_A05G216000v1 [Gossypium barbadense]KAG4200370.1 hypothetical protein ERO13_A05G206700v2 [Gossypium hirsutum]TYH17816.1 hypothetical protein ES288_A05G220700v1 [Gossypium darwinii]TYI28155.1 hypothetical protein ES332_A05G224300v1 [Gossypium tomentosum]TYJ35216.1 hypothetical protein E1A91_A05G221300v1 [Gossypium mustelinum]
MQHFQQSLQVGLLQTLMMGMLVLSVFVSVSGYQKEEPMVVGMKGHNPPHDKHKQPVKVKQQHHQRFRHSFDVFYSSKREVPNASDPLHNR